jgi:dipeptidyl aminopeptidase/acylaminoacyl peptidase
VSDDPLRRAMEDLDVPDATGARERAWTSVSDAFAAAQSRPARRRRAWAGRRRVPVAALGLAVALFIAAVAAGATPPGAAVRTFVVRARGVAPPLAPRARIGPLPPGRMLVTSPRGAWVVSQDGSRRLLGSYAGAAWSPRGLYVAAWSGADLSAVAPDGRVAWTLRTPGPVASAAWSPDGFRVAYRRAGGLGIVAGDGTAPRMLAASVAPAGPAWRPGAPHTLAWVDGSGRVVVRDVDTGALVWQFSGRVGAARSLAWSADGRLLLVGTAGGLRLADPRANQSRAIRLPAGDRAVAAAWAPSGRRLAVVARRGNRVFSRVLVAAATPVLPDRPVFETTGRLASPAWSPDGRRILVRWTDADTWLLLPTFAAPAVPASPLAPGAPGVAGAPAAASAPRAAPVAISPVARRFGGVPTVRGWCCA